ncbi:MAG: tellurite resistance TerB family protein [Methylococcaceae bacterium]
MARKKTINNNSIIGWFLLLGLLVFLFGQYWKIAAGIMFFLWLFYVINKKVTLKKPNGYINSTNYSESTVAIQSSENIKKIRSEIKACVDSHKTAISLLMALARIDGTISEAERRIVFMFLLNQNEMLTEERHFKYFGGAEAREWQRAAKLDDINNLCNQLKTMSLSYRIAVAASAQAIVASGKTPKKSEQSALEIIQGIL